jgi:catechol 2,3-dioxygenase-like lactoylglutathione lyase family enzyme
VIEWTAVATTTCQLSGARTHVITHIHSATIIVSDQDKALEFYTGVLGWEVEIDQPMGDDSRFITVKPKGSQASIALRTSAMFDGRTAPTSGISLIADDVQKTYEELTAKGVKFTMKPERMPWGDVGAHFEDPDGNGYYVNGPAPG